MKRPRSLGFQLLSRSLFILSALLVLIGVLQYVLMKETLYRNNAKVLSEQLITLPRDLMDDDGRNGGRGGPGRPRVFLPDRSLAVIDGEGIYEVERENGNPSPQLDPAEYDEIRDELQSRGSGDTVYRVAKDAEGTEQLLVFKFALGPGSPQSQTLMQMGTPTAPLDDVVMRQLLIFAVLGLVAMSAGLALYRPVLRRTLQPLRTMVRTVERIDAGRLDERFPSAQGQLEIDTLSDSFNRMLERLGASFEAEREAKEQMRRFIADASHELRTPLTSIHGFLEVLQRGAADRPEQLHAALTSMHGESSRMKKLVEDLLLLAKLDRAPQLHLREAALEDIVAGMEPQLLVLAGKRRVRFELGSGLVSLVDADKIKQIVLNLFHNAVQHTDPDKGEVIVSLAAEGGVAALTIRDNGPGIGSEHLSRVFDRFYRVDASRTRSHGGAGLGLSITRSLTEAHGGSIAVSSEPGAGAAFTVRLPLRGKGVRSAVQ